MLDLTPAPEVAGKFRKEWGLQNVVGLTNGGDPRVTENNAFRQQKVRHKIATFVSTAIYPQQLTIPRQYATTREGTFVYKILEGREISGFREDGVRVVIQENLAQARFIMSPLFKSRADALSWAVKHMGANT